mmetsp:Transcript_12354/g.18985  ORF Transcript_12354/g.18985 Transcript_12354/m.18985 type:complete len:351 (-) Transcript_12354:180-1232(-)
MKLRLRNRNVIQPPKAPMTAGMISEMAEKSDLPFLSRQVSFDKENEEDRNSPSSAILQNQQILRQVSFDEDEQHRAALNNLVEESQQTDKSDPSPVFIIPEELSSYWHSTEAKKLFRPKEGETAKESVDAMINILQQVTASNDPMDCRSIIKGSNENYTLLNSNDLRKVRAKAIYLRDAMKLARETIDKGKEAFNFQRCAQQVIDTLGDHFEPYSVKSPGTIGIWLRDFREGRGFYHSNIRVLLELESLVSFFDEEPGLCEEFKSQLVSKLPQLSSKIAFDLFQNNILPIASEKRGYTPNETPQKIIEEFRLEKNMHHIHFHQWLKLEGFQQEYYSETQSLIWTYNAGEE